MNIIGFSLLVAGFLAGAYSTALDVETTNWSFFIPAAILAIVGVFLIKRAASGEATSEKVLAANRAELTESLSNIVTNIDQLIDAGESVSIDGLRDEIDQRLRDDLRRFADARESMIHLFSLQTYADIMSNFATGERYVNRVWSSSADGYNNEARSYLEKARSQFSAASQQLETVGR